MRLRYWTVLPTLLALAAVLVLAGAGLPSVTAAAAQRAPVDPGVYADLAAAPEGQATFVVVLRDKADLSKAGSIRDWAARGQFVVDQLRATADASQPALLERFTQRTLAGHVSRFQPFWITNVVVVEGDRQAVETLARDPAVAAVLPEAKVAPLRGEDRLELTQGVALSDAPATVCDPVTAAWGVPRIGAPGVWAPPYNATGQGIVIGVVDTGVQWDHPALQGQYRGWDAASATVDHNYNWYNPADLCDDSASGTCDADYHIGPPYPDGHGTHVTGITAGYEAPDRHIGVAPGAQWIHALACTSNACPTTAALASLQWMLAPTDLGGANPNPALRPQVVNNSWGGFGGTLVYGDAIAALRAAGVVPVFAAGNSGALGCGTLLSPGDNPAAFGAGSTNPDNGISSFSSRGPNPFTGSTGPHLAAPGGGGICSSEATGGYGYGSGTSMAAPHVAGAVALLLSAEPDLIGQVDQIEEVLRATSVASTSAQTCGGVPGSQIPNNVFGWGRLDAFAAMEMVWQAGTLAGTVTDAVTGLPVANAQVSITRIGHTLTQRTSATGQFSFVAGRGDYDVAVSAFGYTPWATTGVHVNHHSSVVQDAALTPFVRASVSGQVTEVLAGDAPGDPIKQATVEVLGSQPQLAAQTDSTGNFILSSVPQGAQTLRVTAAGYAQAGVPITVSGATLQDVALTPAADYLVNGSGSCAAVYAWVDATDGTAYNLGDDGTVQVTLPAPFTFYGNTYSSLYISANGYVSFGAAYSLVNGVIPFEGPANNAIYAFATDLNPAGGTQGRIYAKTLPGNKFVVQYQQVQHWPSGDPETFEIILDLSSGTIILQYQVVSLPAVATVGVENSAGTRGRVYSTGSTPPLTAGTAVKFVAFSGPLPACSPLAVTLADFSAVQQGDAILLTWETNSELNNRGFNLYRGTSETGPDRQLNEMLIPSQSQGNPGGFVYTWEDRADLVPGTTYFYWVEDVDIYGVATIHGPVGVDYTVPTAVQVSNLQAGSAATQPILWLWVAAMALLALGLSRFITTPKTTTLLGIKTGPVVEG